MNSRVALLAALTALVSAACGTNDAARPEPMPSASSASPPRPTLPGSTSGLSTDSTVDAGGYDALVNGPSVKREREPGISVVVLAVAPDGRVVARVGPRDTVDGDKITLSQNDIELIEPGASEGEVIPGRPGPRPRQAVYADADEQAIVWMETTSTNLGSDGWVILAYDRVAKQTRVIAKAASDDTPRAPNGTVPFLAAGRVYWIAAELTGREGRPARAHIFSRDVAASEPVRREVTDAESLTADGDIAFYTESHSVDPAIPDDGRHIVHRLDLTTGDDSVVEKLKLDDDETFSGLTTSNGDLAWAISTPTADGDPASATLTICAASGTTKTLTGSGVSFFDLVLTPDFLGWNGDSETGEQWLFDRRRKVIVDLGLAPGVADARGSGRHVVWRDKSGDRRTGALAP